MSSTSVTNAGVASGIDFESIIEATVEAKQADLEEETTTAYSETTIEISGVAALKEALETFQDALDEMLDAESFNTKTISNSTDSSDPVFDVELDDDDDASNFTMDVTVIQLATTETLSKTIQTVTEEEYEEMIENGEELEEGTVVNCFMGGTITISLGTDEDGNEISFTVEIEDGYNLNQIRSAINDNDYGVSVTLIQTDDGYIFKVDGGETGEDSTNITITTTTNETNYLGYTSLDIFNYSEATDETDTESENDWTHTDGTDCVIVIDGSSTISSSTNTFEDVISGVTLTVNRLSDTLTEDEIGGQTVYQTTDANGNTVYYKSDTVTVANDESGVADKVSSFVDAYNDLITTLEELYERNTYTDGENNYDGGYLAGNSTVSAIKNYISNLLSSCTTTTESGLTIYNMGISYNTDGTLEFDEDEFLEVLEDNYNSIINLFTDEETGLLTLLNEYCEDYTEYGGILDEWNDELEEELDDIEEQMLEDEEYIEQYEERLREKYTALDTLIANYNSQLSYLSTLISSI